MKKSILFFVCIAALFAACESSNQKLHNKIVKEERAIYADSVVTPKEDSLVKVLIEDYQTFAKQNVNDSLAPEYMFKAADLCKNTTRYKQAIDCWTSIIQKYPKSNRAAYSLFLQAFTYENNMNDTAVAKKLYNNFIEKYPAHPLAASAKASVEQMGIPLEELIKKFEAKNKQAVADKK